MESLLGQGSALALATVFAWAGVVKVRDPDRWHRDLLVYGLGRVLRGAGWLIVPWLELIVPVAVLAGQPRMAAGLALGLVSVFSVAIIRARILVGSNQLACGCFGGNATRDYRLLLARNALLAAPAVFVLVNPPPALLGGGTRLLVTGLLYGLLTLLAAGWMLRQMQLRLQRRAADGGAGAV